jgi:hypothetical protein
MSRLELPSDVAEKVVEMLNPRDAHRAIIACVHNKVFIRKDTCTKEELLALDFSDSQIENGELIMYKDFMSAYEADYFICRAVVLGFEFYTIEHMDKFVRKDGNNSFVMHRRPVPREFA